MTHLSLEPVVGSLSLGDKQILVDGMLDHHKFSGHIRKTDEHTILLKDAAGKVMGGIMPSFLWNDMRVETLWVDPDVRGQNWGQKLLFVGEAEGRKRGCTFSYTDSFTYQAPEFYKKQGYVEYGKLNDFPHGESLIYLKKEL